MRAVTRMRRTRLACRIWKLLYFSHKLDENRNRIFSYFSLTHLLDPSRAFWYSSSDCCFQRLNLGEARHNFRNLKSQVLETRLTLTLRDVNRVVKRSKEEKTIRIIIIVGLRVHFRVSYEFSSNIFVCTGCWCSNNNGERLHFVMMLKPQGLRP